MENQRIFICRPKKKLSMVLLFSAIVLTVLLIILSKTGYMSLSVIQAVDIGVGCFGLAMFLSSTNKYLLLFGCGVCVMLVVVMAFIFFLGGLVAGYFGLSLPENFGIVNFLIGFLCVGALLGIAEFGFLCIFLMLKRR